MGRLRQPALIQVALLSAVLLQCASWFRHFLSAAGAAAPTAFSAPCGADAGPLGLRPTRRLRGRAGAGRPLAAADGDEAPFVSDEELERMMEGPTIERDAGQAPTGGGETRQAVGDPIIQPQRFIPACVAAAIVQGKADKARELVEQGAPLEDRGARQITALGFAAERGELDMVEFLVEKGAKMEAQDQSGRSVLILAAIGGSAEVVEFLIGQGAELEAKDRGGLTALLWASVSGHAEVVKALLKAGADADVEDADGMSALKLAAVFNKVDVARSLVEAGVDPAPGLAMARKFSKCKEVAEYLAEQVSE
uniref:Uncharacterized protein n=1 Tax=Alexandrium monilatum TaxID=311494 RepID=A0A7S4WIP9_9DINO